MKIPYGSHYLDNKDIKSVILALNKKAITQGPLINKFEKKICNLLKVKYAVAVSSCTAGLHIALKSFDNDKGKNTVLTSPVSFVSTSNVIIHDNLKPKFIDISKDTLNIDPKKLEKEINFNKKIKAVIPVHLGGYSGESQKIYDLCKKKNIPVIEDAAHSFGAKYDHKNYVGSCKFSDLTVFSFHPVKTITTGEGGMITTNSNKIYKKLLKLRSHGIEKDSKNWKNKNLGFTRKKPNKWYYEMHDLGLNYRITDFQCALGLSQLNKLKKILKYRKKIAKLYDKEFAKNNSIFLPQKNFRNLSSNHLYILNIDFKKIQISRNSFMNKLYKMGIITQVHYIPIPLHPFYKKFKIKLNKLKNSIKYYHQALSIPIFYNLKLNHQKKIISSIKKIISH